MLFLLCLLASPNMAQATTLEERAKADALETFQKFEQKIEEIQKTKWDSAFKLGKAAGTLEHRQLVYCRSLYPYPGIQNQCFISYELAKTKIQEIQKQLANSGTPDLYEDFRDKIFEAPNSKNETPTIEEIEKKFKALCWQAPEKALREECEVKKSVELAAATKPLPLPPAQPTKWVEQKSKKSSAPMLRCNIRFPSGSEPAQPLPFADPDGGYRFTHMAESKEGVAVQIPLSDWNGELMATAKKGAVKKPIPNMIRQFSDSKLGRNYEFLIAPVLSCGEKISACKAKEVFLELKITGKNGQQSAAAASYPIENDKQFSNSIRVDGAELHDEFRLTCAIASKMRSDGKAFDDKYFGEGN